MKLDDIKNDILDVLRISGVECQDGDLQVEDLGAPHSPPKSIPKGKMAVYSFFYENTALKVGKAGPNSKARYASQHYNAGSAPSTLAASILKAPQAIDLPVLDKSQIKEWLIQNTRRVNFVLDKQLGVDALNLVEAFLICRLSPIYEGFESQRKN